MQRILDVLIAAVILVVPALAIAQAPAASLAANSFSHQYLASTLKPCSSSAPTAPGTL